MKHGSIQRVKPALVWAVSLGFLLLLVWATIRPSRATTQRAQDPAPPNIKMVPAVYGMTTVVGYFHKTPPPWPKGNCFELSPLTIEERTRRRVAGAPAESWFVLNMHTENFEAFVERSGITTVKVERVGKRSCLIVDPRVPNDWLLESPCTTCTPKDALDELKGHAHRFRRK